MAGDSYWLTAHDGHDPTPPAGGVVARVDVTPAGENVCLDLLTSNRFTLAPLLAASNLTVDDPTNEHTFHDRYELIGASTPPDGWMLHLTIHDTPAGPVLTGEWNQKLLHDGGESYRNAVRMILHALADNNGGVPW